MKLTNAIKKLEKNGFQVEVNKNNSQFHIARKPGFKEVIEFTRNGRDDQIATIRTKRIDEQDDYMTDYFCGSWHDNITQAMKFVRD